MVLGILQHQRLVLIQIKKKNLETIQIPYQIYHQPFASQ